MDRKKEIDLIKLEVLGCINEKDIENLINMKENEAEFPWKELAEYQNLVALLPTTLTVVYPTSELKDKTALKLFNLKDEIKAKLDAKRELEKPAELPQELDKDEMIIEETQQDIKITDDEISIDEEENLQINIDTPEEVESESVLESTENKNDLVTETLLDKAQINSAIKDYLKLHLDSEIELLKKNIKKSRILSLILFLISVALIAALYFLK